MRIPLVFHIEVNAIICQNIMKYSNYNSKLLTSFLNEAAIYYKQNELLSRYCSWQIGGPADYICYPDSMFQLQILLEYVDINNIPFVVMGKGSNMLFSDEGISGVVIKLDRQWSGYKIKGSTITAQSGIFSPILARVAAENSLSGLSHIAGIPGNLGGLIVMNGGSLGNSIGDKIRDVKLMTIDGKINTYSGDECDFSYRHSRFQNINEIILEASIELEYGDMSELRREMLAILRSRRKKFPRRQPSCGSVFKSPAEQYLMMGPPGRVVESLGLKGVVYGNAMISDKHANFMVNMGNARAVDILSLVKRVQDAFYVKYSKPLHCEFKYVDSVGNVLSL